MKLFLLERLDSVSWDQCRAHVVRADTDLKARSMCPYRDEGNIWRNPELTSCTEIPLDGLPEVILTQTLDG